MTFEEFKLRVESIPTPYRHPPFLYALIKWLQPVTVVEVGSHIGYSACWMARALQENGQRGTLHCIDSFCWSDQPQASRFRANVADCGVSDTVCLIEGRSEEVQWPPKIDFAFIDGNHVYNVARHDIRKARELGARCIVMHDTVICEGVRRYTESMRSLPDWAGFDFLESMEQAGLLVCLRRDPKGPVTDYDDNPESGGHWDKQHVKNR